MPPSVTCVPIVLEQLRTMREQMERLAERLAERQEEHAAAHTEQAQHLAQVQRDAEHRLTALESALQTRTVLGGAGLVLSTLASAVLRAVLPLPGTPGGKP